MAAECEFALRTIYIQIKIIHVYIHTSASLSCCVHCYHQHYNNVTYGSYYVYWWSIEHNRNALLVHAAALVYRLYKYCGEWSGHITIIHI